MASPSTARVSFCILFLSVCTAPLLSVASAAEYIVGGESGWSTHHPAVCQDKEIYAWWAEIRTFYVGDRLNFNNETDSVQLVNLNDYKNCNTSNPIQELKGNNTVFELRKLGYHQFISGEADNCLAGQRMMVHVVPDDYVNDERTHESFLHVIPRKHRPVKFGIAARSRAGDNKNPFVENRTRDDKDIN
ncbi:Early nodulin-like protein 2 [Rhynchospora pubera]|uniref:Early nodulin-like protein 2 n=1 Tax=Rhynchospora pubera TaxID=906938 RepID=A0AAV8HK73_9POAL|nr:Early nodulin-like protein 2 [Rhynchospora pubera]KAJ4815222.1 Early nodulin-like protein 2 [Rhynchospora pubera]